MEGLLERNTIEITEEERHNAAIKERYRKLFDAVEDQLASVQEENVATTYAPSYNESTSYAATPIVEQAPTVTEYKPSALAASVFTAEKFERLASFEEKQIAAPVEAVAKPVTVTKTATATAPEYSLTFMAKVVIALFTLAVVAMLTLIGINSQIIARKSVQIDNLEAQKQELVETKGEIEARIRQLQTEESILERAKAAGLID